MSLELGDRNGGLRTQWSEVDLGTVSELRARADPEVTAGGVVAVISRLGRRAEAVSGGVQGLPRGWGGPRPV